MTSPILFIIFNRPETTKKVFEEIRRAQPSKLFIAADGPRSYKIGENKLCDDVRSITRKIDWPCELHTDFLNTNIGCDERVPSAISWFFKHVEEGIILEDDCLPSKSFFKFCDDLLEKYRNVNEIMLISGNNFQDGRMRGEGSYYFSRYTNTWGWATWKRAWLVYEHDLAGFSAFKKTGIIRRILPTLKERNYWLNFFEKIKSGKYTFWDAKLMFSIWNNSGISITPNSNLVTNIGFGKEATHTSGDGKKFSVPCQEIPFIKHPTTIEVSDEADRFLFKRMYRVSFFNKAMTKIKILWKKT